MNCRGKRHTIGETMILSIPIESSRKLPSRGMLMVEGSMLGMTFVSPLEPDGRGGHFMELSKEQRKILERSSLEDVELEITLLKDWPDPPLSKEWEERLKQDKLVDVWSSLTPKARWEWIRWIRSTKKEQTREKRIQVASSKLKKGEKRPCCFNTSTCTLPSLSKNGILLVEEEKRGDEHVSIHA